MYKSLYAVAAATLTAILSFMSFEVYAYESGDWLVRARLVNASPNDSTSTVSGNAGTGADVNDDTTLGLDFTYMLTDNVGAELILGTTKHQVTGTGGIAGSDIGTVRSLPPTLTLQYHFQPQSNIRPYAGIGINYTLFYSEKAGGGLGAGASVDYDDSWGLAGQLGVDVDLNDKWFFNFDVKYIDIDTTLTVSNSPTASLNGNTDVTLDPWVIGIGLGTRF